MEKNDGQMRDLLADVVKKRSCVFPPQAPSEDSRLPSPRVFPSEHFRGVLGSILDCGDSGSCCLLPPRNQNLSIYSTRKLIGRQGRTLYSSGQGRPSDQVIRFRPSTQVSSPHSSSRGVYSNGSSDESRSRYSDHHSGHRHGHARKGDRSHYKGSPGRKQRKNRSDAQKSDRKHGDHFGNNASSDGRKNRNGSEDRKQGRSGKYSSSDRPQNRSERNRNGSEELESGRSGKDASDRWKKRSEKYRNGSDERKQGRSGKNDTSDRPQNRSERNRNGSEELESGRSGKIASDGWKNRSERNRNGSEEQRKHPSKTSESRRHGSGSITEDRVPYIRKHRSSSSLGRLKNRSEKNRNESGEQRKHPSETSERRRHGSGSIREGGVPHIRKHRSSSNLEKRHKNPSESHARESTDELHPVHWRPRRRKSSEEARQQNEQLGKERPASGDESEEGKNWSRDLEQRRKDPRAGKLKSVDAAKRRDSADTAAPVFDRGGPNPSKNPEKLPQIFSRNKKEKSPNKRGGDSDWSKLPTIPLDRREHARMGPKSDGIGPGRAKWDTRDWLENPPDGDGPTESMKSWELATKLLRKPLKSLLGSIPPPPVLLAYIRKRFPAEEWASGRPSGRRFYPDASPFVASFPNGSSLVFYPHGGLAVAISAPNPTQQILVFKDPTEGFYFLDKSLLAGLNTMGIGVVYSDDGTIRLRYDLDGGFRLESNGETNRWLWNGGGPRILQKLNPYLSLRILDIDSVHLVFHGNKRGVRFNIGKGHVINLVAPNGLTSTPVPGMDTRTGGGRGATVILREFKCALPYCDSWESCQIHCCHPCNTHAIPSCVTNYCSCPCD